jgi:hypothetical protein
MKTSTKSMFLSTFMALSSSYSSAADIDKKTEEKLIDETTLANQKDTPKLGLLPHMSYDLGQAKVGDESKLVGGLTLV